MTSGGVQELYMQMSVAWPLVIKPGADPEWKRARLQNMYRSFKEYEDAEVLEAFSKWTSEQEKFPTTKNLINEIEWARKRKWTANKENEELWPMDFITKEGIEWSFGLFKRADFIAHPRNTENLQPEEWERRFKLTRKRIINRLIAERGKA